MSVLIAVAAIKLCSLCLQLRDEFVTDRLYPRASVNTGIWMAAIDMAREAHGTDSDYADIM